MKNTLILSVAVALLIGGIGGYAISQGRHDSSRMMESAGYINDRDNGMHRMPEGSMMGQDEDTRTRKDSNEMGMMGGMDHGMMMVGSEKEFITEMIPHHQEAVDTAKQVLARGATTPEVKALVEGIITAQEKEIADMKSWYQAWYGTPYQASGNYTPMMRDLSKLSGKDIDKAFLEDMIMHHMGAIMMAQSVQSHIEHTEVKTLSGAIIKSQAEEIQAMRRILGSL